jgi:hypothetical protein
MTSSVSRLPSWRTAAQALLLVSMAALQACGGDDDEVTTPTVLATDDFTQGTAKWKVEQQDTAGTVTAANGVLDIVQPSGATIWF